MFACRPALGPRQTGCPLLPRRRQIRGEWPLGLGSAKPIACDATAGSALDAAATSRTIESEEDGSVPRTHDVRRPGLNGRRPFGAGSARADRGRQGRREALEAGPPAARAARRLDIQMLDNSAAQLDKLDSCSTWCSTWSRPLLGRYRWLGASCCAKSSRRYAGTRPWGTDRRSAWTGSWTGVPDNSSAVRCRQCNDRCRLCS